MYTHEKGIIVESSHFRVQGPSVTVPTLTYFPSIFIDAAAFSFHSLSRFFPNAVIQSGFFIVKKNASEEWVFRIALVQMNCHAKNLLKPGGIVLTITASRLSWSDALRGGGHF